MQAPSPSNSTQETEELLPPPTPLQSTYTPTNPATHNSMPSLHIPPSPADSGTSESSSGSSGISGEEGEGEEGEEEEGGDEEVEVEDTEDTEEFNENKVIPYPH